MTYWGGAIFFLVIGVVFLALFFTAGRGLVCWFFRLDEMADDLKAIRRHLDGREKET